MSSKSKYRTLFIPEADFSEALQLIVPIEKELKKINKDVLWDFQHFYSLIFNSDTREFNNHYEPLIAQYSKAIIKYCKNQKVFNFTSGLKSKLEPSFEEMVFNTVAHGILLYWKEEKYDKQLLIISCYKELNSFKKKFSLQTQKHFTPYNLTTLTGYIVLKFGLKIDKEGTFENPPTNHEINNRIGRLTYDKGKKNPKKKK